MNKTTQAITTALLLSLMLSLGAETSEATETSEVEVVSARVRKPINNFLARQVVFRIRNNTNNNVTYLSYEVLFYDEDGLEVRRFASQGIDRTAGSDITIDIPARDAVTITSPLFSDYYGRTLTAEARITMVEMVTPDGKFIYRLPRNN